jgi:hypothetical protein
MGLAKPWFFICVYLRASAVKNKKNTIEREPRSCFPELPKKTGSIEKRQNFRLNQDLNLVRFGQRKLT